MVEADIETLIGKALRTPTPVRPSSERMRRMRARRKQSGLKEVKVCVPAGSEEVIKAHAACLVDPTRLPPEEVTMLRPQVDLTAVAALQNGLTAEASRLLGRTADLLAGADIAVLRRFERVLMLAEDLAAWRRKCGTLGRPD